MRGIAFGLAALAAMVFASPATAALQVNGSGQLTGVTEVTVNGVTYNVTFQDGTCAGLFGGCDSVSDFTFQNQPDAQAAGTALLAAILGSTFDSAPGTTFGCIGGASCAMLIPYGFNGILPGSNQFDADAATNFAAFNSAAILLTAPPTFDSTTDIQRVWALFSPATGAVPEPATWAMMLLGFGAIGLALRRRTRHVVPLRS